LRTDKPDEAERGKPHDEQNEFHERLEDPFRQGDDGLCPLWGDRRQAAAEEQRKENERQHLSLGHHPDQARVEKASEDFCYCGGWACFFRPVGKIGGSSARGRFRTHPRRHELDEDYA